MDKKKLHLFNKSARLFVRFVQNNFYWPSLLLIHKKVEYVKLFHFCNEFYEKNEFHFGFRIMFQLTVIVFCKACFESEAGMTILHFRA